MQNEETLRYGHQDYEGDVLEDLLTRIIGKPLGLDADWSVSAWKIDGGTFWCDNEDGTYSLVRRLESDWDTITVIDTLDPYELKTELEVYNALKTISAQIGCSNLGIDKDGVRIWSRT